MNWARWEGPDLVLQIRVQPRAARDAFVPEDERLRVRITAPPVDGAAKVADCSSNEIPLEPGDLGYASFSTAGDATSCNPCISSCATPVQATTWSKIKGAYTGR